ncbi:porphobilinogen deaminase [Halyomorpha halys]|uniref:porphobilinogen deaminase n=1 Tax=Halyomorpha halys TaxID=286706 RepID=UPI0006D4CFD8|nr:porphobilinogen deaminase [Halyomorpha halys]
MAVQMVMDKKVYRVGSRESELALIQTNLVIEYLQEKYPKCKFEIVTMSTLGDQILDKPLPKIGEKSLFTKELETALENGSVDFVVHSLKDMPTALPNGLAIGAVLEREDPRDAILLNSKLRGSTLSTLPEKSVIGTSSLRRTAQLKRKYPHLVIKDIRGNLQTRLRKLEQGHYDGIVLAAAGVNRMGWEHHISKILDNDEMMYAVGQGALAVECRSKDCKYFSSLNHEETVLRIIAERSLLCALGGGCSAPVAVFSEYKDETLKLSAAVWSLDGQITVHMDAECDINEKVDESKRLPFYCGISDCGLNQQKVLRAFCLGSDLAKNMSEKGALRIIEEAKASIAATI